MSHGRHGSSVASADAAMATPKPADIVSAIGRGIAASVINDACPIFVRTPPS